MCVYERERISNLCVYLFHSFLSIERKEAEKVFDLRCCPGPDSRQELACFEEEFKLWNSLAEQQLGFCV